MNKKDFVIGEVYHCTCEYDNTYWVSKLVELGNANNFKDSPYYSNMNIKSFQFRISNPSYSGRTIRLATFDEKQHLLQCIAAGKYVEYKKSNNLTLNYLIL